LEVVLNKNKNSYFSIKINDRFETTLS